VTKTFCALGLGDLAPLELGFLIFSEGILQTPGKVDVDGGIASLP